jgi:hypothetical protein
VRSDETITVKGQLLETLVTEKRAREIQRLTFLFALDTYLHKGQRVGIALLCEKPTKAFHHVGGNQETVQHETR